MTPTFILTELQAHLADYATRNHGKLSIAPDQFAALELLANAPRGWQAILTWAGDAIPGDTESGATTHTIEIIIQQQRGLPVKPGDNLLRGLGDAPGLLDLVSQIRARIRGFELADALSAFEYRGTSPEIAPGDLPLDAYRLRFTLLTRIPTEQA